uniref:Uncharacterized protein n=1 Tax=Tanacetum cinerariifolium TaxID=118510 RepID=A0A6L2J0M6_TANCI|nr:hypothetical protein [Tanacetum cinerariifolium]
MFNGWVDLLSLHIRCPTDESICYRYTLDVHRLNYDDDSHNKAVVEHTAWSLHIVVGKKALGFETNSQDIEKKSRDIETNGRDIETNSRDVETYGRMTVLRVMRSSN